MRIRAKYISGYLVIALVTTGVAALSFFATRTLENAFRAVSEETIPLITSMDELRYSASRVVASATEVALAVAMDGGQAAGSVAAEEQQELDMGYEGFQQARNKYIEVVQSRTEHRLRRRSSGSYALAVVPCEICWKTLSSSSAGMPRVLRC